MVQLHEVLRTPQDLLALEPEELGGVLLEVAPSLPQFAGFTLQDIMARLFAAMVMPGRESNYDHRYYDEVGMALAEALSWLESHGLIVRNPGQPGAMYVLTRRAAKLGSSANLAAFQAARMLPTEMLQPEMAQKVQSLFARGDYATAVFQAFKMVEVEVRRASGLEPDDIGEKLMRKAFDKETGPLTDMSSPEGERLAMAHLFSGAIGYAKNPGSHRDVQHSRQSAARLIIFASELLEIVRIREILG